MLRKIYFQNAKTSFQQENVQQHCGSGSATGNIIEEHAKPPAEFVVEIFGRTGNVMDLNIIVTTEMQEENAEKLVKNVRISTKQGIRLFFQNQILAKKRYQIMFV